MRLTIQNGKPALVREDGQILLHSIYTGTRYWGTMWNVLKDYTEQVWTVRESEPFVSEKDFSALGKDVRYFVAQCSNSTLYAALTSTNVLFRTETCNVGDDKQVEAVIALGGLYAKRFERAMHHTYSGYNGLRVFDMCSGTQVKRFCECDSCDGPVHMPILDEDGQALHAGFVSYERYFSSVAVNECGTMELRHFVDSGRIPAGNTLASDWMLLSFYEDMVEDLPQFTRFVHDFNRFVDRHTDIPVGFSTWYYYMSNIDERTVFENLAICDAVRDRVPLRVFQLDDGWSSGNHNGDARSDRFPQGMKYYADCIREHGMIPGLWLAPFHFARDSDTVREHPEWFVRNTDGELAMCREYCMLDVTHPGAKQYVQDLYHKLTYDWGGRYLKIDIVSNFMTVGVYHDPQAGALQNVREYFRLAREAAHPDTYLLGCTCPIFEVAEFLDGMRVGIDIFERWESLPDMFGLVLKRYYLNGNLFLSDPDCLLVRKAEQEDADCRRYCTRTDEEIHTFLVAMYAAGGALMVSDKLPLLTDRQMDQYARMFPVSNRVGKPLDLMQSYVPGLLDLGVQDGVRRVALINWGERERSFRVMLKGKFHATEHFTDEELGLHDGVYEVVLAPHCAQLVEFRPVK